MKLLLIVMMFCCVGRVDVICVAAEAATELRAGIIGCDTSHASAFTKILNAPNENSPFGDIRVVAAFPGGSDDIPSSRDRVSKYTTDLKGMGVEIVDSIADLLERVDVVLLESVDGRVHLAQAQAVIVAKKPIFIDKPIAGSLADAIRIFQLAKKHGTPCFSCSALRFSPEFRNASGSPEIGKIVGCMAYSPCELEEHHPDLFWYGIHGVEELFTIMGTGCDRVTRVRTDQTDVVVGVWDDGRVGSFYGMRTGKYGFGAVIYGTKAIVHIDHFSGYEPLVEEIALFFKTGKPPVSVAETLEIMAFMEAADESKRQGGVSVTIESVLEKARAEVARHHTK